MPTTEDLIKDIHTRVEAMDAEQKAALSDARLRQIVTELFADPASEFVRKFQFGGQSAPELIGTKYARWGLNVADIEFLYDLQESLRGKSRPDGSVYQGPSEALTRTFEQVTGAVYISDSEIRQIDKKAIDNLYPRVPRSAFGLSDRVTLKRGGAWQDTKAYERLIRAMDTAESGFGSQLVGAQYVGELWEAARRESQIFGLIGAMEMTDPTMYIPVEVDFPEMLFVAENAANNSSEYTTTKTGSQRVTVTAKKFIIHQMWSGEMDEDSIIPFVPFLRAQAMKSVAHYSDSAVLNGDDTNAATGNINLDDADPADTKHYLAFDGIRHASLIDNTANQLDLAGPITLQALNNQRARMIDFTRLVDWGHPNDKNDLVYVSDVTTADQIALLDEVVTYDKYNAQATIFNGELAKILGHPLIGSMAMSKTEADGKVSTTANNNTKGQVTAFNRQGFKVGWRRRVKTETERLPARDQTRIVYSLRMGFGRFSPTGSASGIEASDTIFDISI
jgi:HK97 family phage major capsid protein